MELLAQHGLRGLSIRALAGAVGLAPNAIYSYFIDREHLQAAVASEVAARLHKLLVRACTKKTSKESIVSLANAYLQFAKRQHLLYEALVVTRPAAGEYAIAPERLWLFFLEQVRRITGDARAGEAAVALWAFLHGIAVLQSAQAFNAEKPTSSFAFGLSAWIRAANAARNADHASSPSGIAQPEANARGRRAPSKKNIASAVTQFSDTFPIRKPASRT